MDHSHEHSVSEERAILVEGGEKALADLLAIHQEKLERIISFRIAPLLRSRVDPADVLQDAYFEISRRINEFIRITGIVLCVDPTKDHSNAYRYPSQSHARKTGRPPRNAFGFCSVRPYHKHLHRSFFDGRHYVPSQAAVREEEIQQLQSALESMNETDREVIAMRHFEHLNNQQVAEVLDISPTAASNRYVRAAAKLSEILNHIPSRRPLP